MIPAKDNRRDIFNNDDYGRIDNLGNVSGGGNKSEKMFRNGEQYEDS